MSDARAKAGSVAKATGLELVELIKRIPDMLWRTIIGGFIGLGLGFAVGVAMVLIGGALGWTIGEGWTAWLLGAASVTAFTLGGAYIGGLYGCAAALASAIDELRWVERLWNQVRPHVQRYASAVREGANRAEAKSAALAHLKKIGLTSDAGGLAEKAERFVAALIHIALTKALLMSFVSAVDTDGGTWEQIEANGLIVAQESLGDIIARMFHGPALVAMTVTVVVATAPYAVATFIMA